MFTKTKTVESVFEAFTKDLSIIAEQQKIEAAIQEQLEDAARSAKLKAVNQEAKAQRAMNNIMNMLTGEPVEV